MVAMTLGAVCPTYSPLSSSALHSTNTSRFSTPYALKKRNMSRATVVLPVPGLPVSTMLRHALVRISEFIWPSPLLDSAYLTFPRISSNHFLTPAIPTSASTSSSTCLLAARSFLVARWAAASIALIDAACARLTAGGDDSCADGGADLEQEEEKTLDDPSSPREPPLPPPPQPPVPKLILAVSLRSWEGLSPRDSTPMVEAPHKWRPKPAMRASTSTGIAFAS
mmetsp:Transcript_82039/g.163900  ORF Transcript_82039/g.163900 Transcript_82039/m.163900 type:complete len:224 (+) Transcript_82039:796-1467(+)